MLAFALGYPQQLVAADSIVVGILTLEVGRLPPAGTRLARADTGCRPSADQLYHVHAFGAVVWHELPYIGG